MISKTPSNILPGNAGLGAKPRKPPSTARTIPRTAKPIAFPELAGASPDPANFSAKYGPRMNTSQTMPTIAPPPPALLLNQGDGQCRSSPTRRRIVIASVMTAGTKIRRIVLGWVPGVLSAMVTSDYFSLIGNPSFGVGTPAH